MTSKALLDALDSDEITLEEFTCAKDIKFDINDEDVPLFIRSLETLAPDEYTDFLRNISRVEYTDDPIPPEYSGAYMVTLNDNTTQVYGWKDSDSLAVLYPFGGESL